MGTAIPLYGFASGGGSGGTLTVTAPAGVTVTVSKDGKSKTKVSDSSGMAVFKGLSTGDWTVVISDGSQTSAPKTVTITADYETAITFFSATIHVTYPAGSTCTATDGVTTLTAPDTSGTWECVVPNAGTWTVSLGNGFHETVSIENEETKTIDKWYLYNAGDERTYITGGVDYHSMVTYSGGGDYPKGTVTKNETNIYLSNSGQTQSPVATGNKIDVSAFTKLCARISDLKYVTGGYYQLGLYSAYNAGKNQVSAVNLSEGIVELDISGVEDGSYYAAVVLNGSASASSHATVHEIWLE